jgi:uncharacterized protein
MKIDRQLLERILQICESNKNANAAFFARLKRSKPKNLDKLMTIYHNEVFEHTDCLECANCCKTISPTLYEPDIERLARRIKMKIPAFKDEYTLTDEENDYIFKNAPCPFLLPDNYCLVYTDRPKACREYPHTDRKRAVQILHITEKNMAVCPAVFEIVEKLKKDFAADGNR